MVRNALDRARAPRFFLGRTSDGNRWRFRDDLADDLVARLNAVCEQEPVATDLRDPPYHDARYREILATHAPIEQVWAEASHPPPATSCG